MKGREIKPLFMVSLRRGLAISKTGAVLGRLKAVSLRNLIQKVAPQ